MHYSGIPMLKCKILTRYSIKIVVKSCIVGMLLAYLMPMNNICM